MSFLPQRTHRRHLSAKCKKKYPLASQARIGGGVVLARPPSLPFGLFFGHPRPIKAQAAWFRFFPLNQILRKCDFCFFPLSADLPRRARCDADYEVDIDCVCVADKRHYIFLERATLSRSR